MNIFLTGDIQIGKSTIIKKVIKYNNKYNLGGYLTKRVKTDVGNDFISYPINKSNLDFKIISTNFNKKERNISISEFERLSSYLLENLNKSDLIIIDEIGNAEEDIPVFKESIIKILKSHKPVLGVLRKCDSPFINTIKQMDNTLVFNVSKDNRDFLHKEILKTLKILE